MPVLLVYKSNMQNSYTRNIEGSIVIVSSHNELQNDFNLQFNFSSYRGRKPLIMDIEVMRVPINGESSKKLEYFLKLKDRLQNTYENAIKSKQRFVIPKLSTFKQKYTPACCNNNVSDVDPFATQHNHFEYKILQLLDILKTYLEDTIKVPQKILEIKLLEPKE
ncbi:MAG: hypothetical protein ACW99A_16625 [Candidatus Kariarchaeaceae archaeon]|jgi:hypothetical protein